MEKDKATEQQQPQQQAQPNASTSGKCSDEFKDEFYNSGRIGRRNAMPDILDEHCETTTADLPLKLSALTTSGELREKNNFFSLSELSGSVLKICRNNFVKNTFFF
jgi:hypothetical protein